jgi:hypothetical protein
LTRTTILLESETRQLLRREGRKEQTYDDLINELVAERRDCKCKRREVWMRTGTHYQTHEQSTGERTK